MKFFTKHKVADYYSFPLGLRPTNGSVKVSKGTPVSAMVTWLFVSKEGDKYPMCFIVFSISSLPGKVGIFANNFLEMSAENYFLYTMHIVITMLVICCFLSRLWDGTALLE